MLGEIKRHPNYIASDDGTIYRKEGPNIFKLKQDWSNGYARVKLDGRHEYVGKLILETFDPPESSYYKVFYIDGDKTNNTLDNLAWLTPSDIQLYSAYTVEYRKEVLGRW